MRLCGKSEPLPKRGALASTALLLMLAAAPVSAAGIVIKSAALRLVNGFYLLDANLGFKLGKESLEALDNGVALSSSSKPNCGGSADSSGTSASPPSSRVTGLNITRSARPM